jgi:preprotein translocase subunit SecA
MLRDLLDHPPASHDHRPEKPDVRPGFVESLVKGASGAIGRFVRSRLRRPDRIVPLVEAHAGAMSGMTDGELREEAGRLGAEMRRHGFLDPLVGRTFALIRETATRTLGKRHYDVQLMGGWVLLAGAVAEMETGEGKTLTATLAAGTVALAGVPVHVLSVNDYLTARDAEEMGPVYRALGLTVGCVVHEVPLDRRREAYANDIVYCTNKDVVFDYLRDRLVLKEFGGMPLRLQAESLYDPGARNRRLMLRGLHYAITDEADSLLIDESRTPLIISGAVVGRDEIRFLEDVLDFARRLEEGRDFKLDLARRTVGVTAEGDRKIDLFPLPTGSPWINSIRKNEMVRRAVSALHLFERDKEYLVRDGKVQIIDVFTGRVMPDRTWEQGLQQLIEIKEGCEPSRQQDTVAKISYQKFFRKYRHLSGMTGTAKEVRGELGLVYGLPVVRIRTHRPLQRRKLPVRIEATIGAKERLLLDRIRAIHADGRPVLVGTGSVAASERVSALLAGAGLPHQVLNAKNDKAEADIVARAGEPGAITIATNMAGRGTDIKLGPGVEALGGLHVILTERHEAARIDRQLAGRCARQGDPGIFEEILSLEDPLMEGGGGAAAWILRRIPSGSPLWIRVAEAAIVRAQRRTERYYRRMRRELFRQDMQSKNRMSFSGREE